MCQAPLWARFVGLAVRPTGLREAPGSHSCDLANWPREHRRLALSSCTDGLPVDERALARRLPPGPPPGHRSPACGCHMSASRSTQWSDYRQGERVVASHDDQGRTSWRSSNHADAPEMIEPSKLHPEAGEPLNWITHADMLAWACLARIRAILPNLAPNQPESANSGSESADTLRIRPMLA